jgi:hypothetical protein
MSTAEITSPRAAERYFSNTLIGQVSTFLAQRLAGSPARRSPSPSPSPRGRPGGAPLARKTDPATRPPGLFDRIDAWLWRQEQKRREAYLAESRDLFDLERRMEALDRAAFTRYY